MFACPWLFREISRYKPLSSKTSVHVITGESFDDQLPSDLNQVSVSPTFYLHFWTLVSFNQRQILCWTSHQLSSLHVRWLLNFRASFWSALIPVPITFKFVGRIVIWSTKIHPRLSNICISLCHKDSPTNRGSEMLQKMPPL